MQGVSSYPQKHISQRQQRVAELQTTNRVELPDHSPSPLDQIIGQSEVVQRLRRQILKAAACDWVVLLRGESGTGKTLVARVIHELSARGKRKAVEMNCAAIPPELMRSSLFGQVRGAFTGAIKDQQGLFGKANGSTIILDEIGDFPFEVQAALLTVIQDGLFTPVGSNSDQKTDARIICATNIDLEKAVAERRFREDLYYRLDVISITLPPLRTHCEDISMLLDRFIINDCPALRLTSAARALLCSHHWPGNVRQLEHTLKKLAFEADGAPITADLVEKQLGMPEKSKASVPLPIPQPANSPDTELPAWVQSRADLKSFCRKLEQLFYARMLQRHDDSIPATAADLGMSYDALYKTLRRAKVSST